MQRRHFLHMTSLAGIGMTAGTGLAAMGRKPDAGEAALPRASDSVVEIPDMILGDPSAPVEIIEYASFTCAAEFSHAANTTLFRGMQWDAVKLETTRTLIGSAKWTIPSCIFVHIHAR